MKHWESEEDREGRWKDGNQNQKFVSSAYESEKEGMEHTQSTIKDHLKNNQTNKKKTNKKHPKRVVGIVKSFTAGENPNKRGFCGYGQKVELLSVLVSTTLS